MSLRELDWCALYYGGNLCEICPHKYGKAIFATMPLNSQIAGLEPLSTKQLLVDHLRSSYCDAFNYNEWNCYREKWLAIMPRKMALFVWMPEAIFLHF